MHIVNVNINFFMLEAIDAFFSKAYPILILTEKLRAKEYI